MSILLITDTQLGMALKNVNSKQWSPKILKWSGEFEPSEKEAPEDTVAGERQNTPETLPSDT